MKIGIFTFHRSRNYGAVMQTYGLLQTLKKLGHDVNVVDYHCEKIKNDLSKIGSSQSFAKKIAKKTFAVIKEFNFTHFNKKHLDLVSYNGFYTGGYDLQVCGSDQVWNSKITGSDKVYFAKIFTGHKLAYAASCGDELNLEEADYPLIKEFDAVSVRENMLAEDLFSHGIDVMIVPDPTILAGRDIFEGITGKKIVKHKYVFVYMIWESKDLIVAAKKYADRNGFQLVTNKNCREFFMHSSPTDFLSWIKNAEAVFTNSFHGTVFSLLFEKQFKSSIVKPNNGKNTRILQLLTDVGCEENIIWCESDEVMELPQNDLKKINTALSEMQRDGIRFLKESINKMMQTS